MAIFENDLQALIIVIIIGISLYAVNRLFSYLIFQIKRIPVPRKNKITFGLKIVSVVLFVYFLIEGFPSFTNIPTEYTAIITGGVSTALAFATSGILSNLVTGILIWTINPFDVGDIVKIKGHKGIIRAITLSKVVMETFNRIIVEISNSDVVSSIILNYTIKLRARSKYFHFRRQIRSPQEIGNARVDMDAYNEESRREEESEIRKLFDEVNENKHSEVHTFTFKMRFPYEQFRIKIDKIKKICERYTEIFGFTPKFHIHGFSNEIDVKFRILTLDPEKLLNYQPNLANEIYKVILGETVI